MLTLLLSLAHAATPAEVLARVEEVAHLRADRLADWATDLSDDDYTTAAGGKIATGVVGVEGHKARIGYGVGVFDQPIAKLWAAINDDAGKVEATSLEYAEVLEGQTCQTPRRVFQFLPLPMVSDRWWISHFAKNDAMHSAAAGRARELAWDSKGTPPRPETATAAEWADKGIPLAWTKGAWLLVDIDGTSTLLEYQTWTDPGGNLPAGAVSRFSAGGIDDTLRVVAELAAKGTSCAVE